MPIQSTSSATSIPKCRLRPRGESRNDTSYSIYLPDLDEHRQESPSKHLCSPTSTLKAPQTPPKGNRNMSKDFTRFIKADDCVALSLYFEDGEFSTRQSDNVMTPESSNQIIQANLPRMKRTSRTCFGDLNVPGNPAALKRRRGNPSQGTQFADPFGLGLLPVSATNLMESFDSVVDGITSS
eukprot:scaffold4690_cov116-Cylindrotheca_fusiformis.AAC.2